MPSLFAPFFASCDRGDSKKTELLGYIRARAKPHTNKISPPSKEGKIAYFLFLAPRPVIFSGFEKSASLFPVFFTLWGNCKVYIYRGNMNSNGLLVPQPIWDYLHHTALWQQHTTIQHSSMVGHRSFAHSVATSRRWISSFVFSPWHNASKLGSAHLD